MLYILLFVFLIIIFIYIIKHYKIDIRSLFHKGIIPKRDFFGLVCYTGLQGSLKTYSIVKDCIYNNNIQKYGNLKSIVDCGVVQNYTYFEPSLDFLCDILETKTNCIIVYDELFKLLKGREDKIPPRLKDNLKYLRKRKQFLITSCQDWLDLNPRFRKQVRIQIESIVIKLPFLSFQIRKNWDAENMKWDNLQNEYVSPLISCTISKVNKYVFNAYDTNEII